MKTLQKCYKNGTQVQTKDGWRGRVLQTAEHINPATWAGVVICTCQDENGTVRLVPESELQPA